MSDQLPPPSPPPTAAHHRQPAVLPPNIDVSDLPWAPWAIAGGGAVATLGVFLPWMSVVSGFGGIDVTGMDTDDGKIVVLLAIAVAIIGIVMLRTPKRMPVAALAVAVPGLIVSIIDYKDVSDRVSGVSSEFARAEVGYGLYMTIAGFAAAILGGLALKFGARAAAKPASATPKPNPLID